MGSYDWLIGSMTCMGFSWIEYYLYKCKEKNKRMTNCYLTWTHTFVENPCNPDGCGGFCSLPIIWIQ